MCRPDERTHKHHIIPRYMGGPDTPENIVEVTVTQHSMFHFCNYQLWSNEEDRIAWRALSGLITTDEVALEAMALGAKKGGKIVGNKNKKNKTGICGLSPEERSEAGKKGGKIGGNKCKENKIGIFARSPEKMIEDAKKGGKISGNKSKKNKTGICGLSLEERSEAGKKGGKISGNKSKENKTGIFGRSPKKMTEDCRKAGKTTSSQKWQCTQTGYTSTACGLTHYQNKRGIDTSKRIKVDGPKAWEITFQDGRVIVTQNLKDWAKENGCSYYCLLEVRKGKNKKHKGIVKVVCL